MSFLKKHWRFTVPAVVVLCVLLLGVVALYSTSEPPEPKTVYVMPDSSSDNPPALNTGGALLSSSTAPDAELVTLPTHRATAHEGLQTEAINKTAPIAAVQEPINQNTEVLEPCCPDDGDIADAISIEPDGVFRAGLTFENWMSSMQEHLEKERAHNTTVEEQGDQFISLLQQIIAKVPLEQRRAIRAEAEASMSQKDLEHSRAFWEGVPQQSDKTVDEAQNELHQFIEIFQALQNEQRSLQRNANQLFDQ